MGEDPNRVFNVGALGIENINRLDLMSKEEFETSVDFKLKSKNLLVTFHPVTLESATSEGQFKALLKALDELEDTAIIITKPNADTDGRIIIDLIDQYVADNKDKAITLHL